jgi:outer membrane immunogenic protein
MKRWIAVFGMALATCGAPALAADLGGAPPVSLKDEMTYAPPFSWTGGYAGLQIGYGWADTDARSGPLAGFDQSYSYQADGFLGGGHIGFNFQKQGVVYGLEADLDLTDLNKTSTGSLGDSHKTSIDWMGSIRGRIGLANGRNLFYLTGGWAFGDVNVRSESGLVSYSETLHGWTIGGGMERSLTNNMTARLEYRYTDLGNASGSDVGFKDDTDVTMHAIRAGISVKF